MCGMLALPGADINYQDEDGDSALILAAFYGRAPAVKELIARGAKLTLTDKAGRDALACARDKGRADCVALLEQALVRVFRV